MKLKMLVELDYDAELWHGEDQEAKAWLMELLKGENLVLHENADVCDEIGTVKVLEIAPA